ncbi:MAG: SDR family oxidoreductase [Alphaproteobacteria bacterium]|jgi:NAD(P)-dependent dehydrogenase (short-subunit alcohol dehydrogenase family)|nr:SDR family oxidoreductase [Alphaproteobacteria bacterium]HJP22697.1 SDR family oxidoreductase [Alphaproteobacteria bacterium]
MTGLAGKRVIVTAGASGLGKAIAEDFVSHGARVLVCDIDEGALAALAGDNPAIIGRLADIADESDVESVLATAGETLGGLDVLVNNGGVSGPTAGIEAIEAADWRRTMAVNLESQFLFIRGAVPLLRAAGGGAIVNVASTAGLMGYPLRSPYAASKWAVIGLSKTLAMELGPDRIRVNAVCPGSLTGPRMDGVIAVEAEAKGLTAEQVREIYLRQTSMRTFITPQEVAAMVVYLCSDAARNITGQAISVDGNNETLGG